MATVRKQIMPMREVLETLGVSKTTLYRWIHAGTFPAPLILGPQKRAWRESDISAWLASLQTVVVSDTTAHSVSGK